MLRLNILLYFASLTHSLRSPSTVQSSLSVVTIIAFQTLFCPETNGTCVCDSLFCAVLLARFKCKRDSKSPLPAQERHPPLAPAPMLIPHLPSINRSSDSTSAAMWDTRRATATRMHTARFGHLQLSVLQTSNGGRSNSTLRTKAAWHFTALRRATTAMLRGTQVT